MTAAERREQIVDAAVIAFSEAGYAGTTTEQVARLAGVSQPYVIRIFGSKQNLFQVVLAHAADRIEASLRHAAEFEPTITGLGRSFQSLLGDRSLVTVLLHGFAAGHDPIIGMQAKDCFGRLYLLVRELTGASADQACDFLARGVLSACLVAIRAVGPGAEVADLWMVDLLRALAIEDGSQQRAR